MGKWLAFKRLWDAALEAFEITPEDALAFLRRMRDELDRLIEEFTPSGTGEA